MNRVQYPHILLMVLASAGIWFAHSINPVSGAAAVPAKGPYAVTFHVLAPSTVPDGASISCSAKVTRKLSLLERLNPGPGAIESGQGTARVVNSAADCTVQLPSPSATRARAPH